MNRNKSRTVAAVAIFMAIMLVIEVISQTIFLTFSALPIKPTVTHIPVIAASIIYGPKVGAVLGGFMGMMSLIRATVLLSPLSYWFSPFVEHGSLSSLFIALVPRILIGVVPYFIYQFLKKYSQKEGVAAFISGLVGSLTNTILVLSGVFLLFSQVYKGNIQVLLAAIFSSNALVEMCLAAVLSASLIPSMLKLKK